MSNRKSSPQADLVAFLAVLTVGVVLVCIARVPAGSIADFAVGLSAMHAAYSRRDSNDK